MPGLPRRGSTGGLSKVIADGAYVPLTSSAMYVASSGVAATDTAALQAAHDALPAGGGSIFLDSGPYLLTADTVNFTKPTHLLGRGPNGASAASGSSYLTTGTVINCASATGVAIAVNSDGCSFERLALFNTAGSTPTAGAGIQVATLGKSTRFSDCSFDGFWTNLEFVNGYEWFITRCHFFDPVTYGIRLRDVGLADAGDGIISDCFIYSGPNNLAPTAGIQWESGGGLKVIGTKINKRGSAKFSVGIDFQAADGISTSVGIVSGCSIENVDYGVLVQLKGPSNTGTFSKVAVTGNEFLTNQYAIGFSAAATGKIKDCIASGNVGNGGAAFFLINRVDGVDLIGNHINTGAAAAFNGSSFTSVTNLFIDGIAFTTAGRPAATMMRAGSRYYDTTLSKPAWSDGTAWRDAAGTAV